jgi:hypothetical protein
MTIIFYFRKSTKFMFICKKKFFFISSNTAELCKFLRLSLPRSRSLAYNDPAGYLRCYFVVAQWRLPLHVTRRTAFQICNAFSCVLLPPLRQTASYLLAFSSNFIPKSLPYVKLFQSHSTGPN